MKTKIIVVNATILVLFGCVVAWGQSHPTTGRNNEASVKQLSNPNHRANPNQYSYQDQYLNGLTNLTGIEFERIEFYKRIRGNGSQHISPSLLGMPDSYNQMTEDQKCILDILFRASRDVKTKTTDKINNLERRKAALQIEKPVQVLDPWRKINGEVVYVLSPNSAFMNCAGTVIQTIDGGVLVRPLLDIAGNYFIKNFPFQVADGYELDSSKFMARRGGLKKLTTVLGAERTIAEMDYGVPCARPKGGEKIEAEAQAPNKIKIQDELYKIEFSLKECRDAAAGANRWVADFVQQIENDKIMAIEKEKQRQVLAVEKEKQRQELIKETAKNKLLKNLQDLADKGDKYGLLYMGERYRDGDGVPKDLNKARDYLSKAAAAGSLTAADELKKLPPK